MPIHGCTHIYMRTHMPTPMPIDYYYYHHHHHYYYISMPTPMPIDYYYYYYYYYYIISMPTLMPIDYKHRVIMINNIIINNIIITHMSTLMPIDHKNRVITFSRAQLANGCLRPAAAKAAKRIAGVSSSKCPWAKRWLSRSTQHATLRGGHFEYRHTHTRAMDTPSAMPR